MNRFIPVAVAAVIAAGAAWYFTQFVTPDAARAENAAPAGAEATPAAASTHGTELAEKHGVTEMTLGNAAAKVTVIEYASFTCPHCGDFHNDQFKKLKAEYIDTGKINFIYRDVYFDGVAVWASQLARCETPRFFGVTAMLYAKQKDWLSSRDVVKIGDSLRQLGKVAGLSEEGINTCLNNEAKAKKLVAWSQETTAAHGIESAPSIVINGTRHGNMAYPELKKLIDAELAK